MFSTFCRVRISEIVFFLLPVLSSRKVSLLTKLLSNLSRKNLQKRIIHIDQLSFRSGRVKKQVKRRKRRKRVKKLKIAA